MNLKSGCILMIRRRKMKNKRKMSFFQWSKFFLRMKLKPRSKKKKSLRKTIRLPNYF